jgi:hypothetical protein
MSECFEENENHEEEENDLEASGESRSVTPPSSTACPPITDESSRRDSDEMLRKATKIIGHFARVGRCNTNQWLTTQVCFAVSSTFSCFSHTN